MKKVVVISLILILLCVFALPACDNAGITPDNNNAQQTTDANGDKDSPDNPTTCGHTFGEWKTVKEATCKEEGHRTRTCNKCSETEDESIPKSEIHTSVIDAAVPATCKATGLTEGSHCSRCNKVLVAQTTIPTTNDHIVVTDAAVSATCKTTGLTEGSHCSRCNKVFVTQTKVPKTNNHTFAIADVSFKCTGCGLNVIRHGNTDGSLVGGNSKVKYYVTGDLEQYKDFEIVIYGSGDMPNFSRNNLPPWHNYLEKTVKITIEENITSIGAYAFYCPTSIISCNFVMSNTVKTIKTNAIALEIKNLVLGNSVEFVESDGFQNVDAVYIPKSLKKLYIDALGNEIYFYEGSLEEFYQIEMYIYNRSMTVKDVINMFDDNFISNIHIYVRAKNIYDRSNYWR